MTMRTASCWLLLALAVAAPRSAQATVLEEATASSAAMAEAQQAMPWNQLSREVRARVQPIVAQPSLYRRLPKKSIVCDPEMHVFLVRHPDVIVNIWEIMGISKVRIQQTGELSYRAVDGAGTFADLQIVYGTPELHVIFARGTYEGPLFRNKLSGDCVLLLRTSFQRGPDGQIVAVNQLDAFVQLENIGLDLIARTLQPVMGKAADFNFVEATGFVGRVSQAAEVNGPGVQRLAGRLTNVPQQTRDEFAEVAAHVAQRAAARTANARPVGGPALAPGEMALPAGYPSPYGAPRR